MVLALLLVVVVAGLAVVADFWSRLDLDLELLDPIVIGDEFEVMACVYIQLRK